MKPGDVIDLEGHRDPRGRPVVYRATPGLSIRIMGPSEEAVEEATNKITAALGPSAYRSMVLKNRWEEGWRGYVNLKLEEGGNNEPRDT